MEFIDEDPSEEIEINLKMTKLKTSNHSGGKTSNKVSIHSGF